MGKKKKKRQQKKYQWAKGQRLAADPQKVGMALSKLEKASAGVVTADLVLQHAKDERSPLHGLFEWDDRVAARRYRLGQARNIINSIRTVDADTGYLQRCFVKVKTKTARSYAATESKRPDLKGAVLLKALEALDGVLARFDTLEELAPVRRAVERVRRQADKQKAS